MTDKKVNIETVKAGMANGISEHLAEKQAIEGPQATLDEQDKKDLQEYKQRIGTDVPTREDMPYIEFRTD